ncbi:MAG TPA: TIGR01777 family oxidoreductase [Polyangiaceae bacterium]|nr:TIGR01777 family oxidoreductase [Polyangiaceae bacterium]
MKRIAIAGGTGFVGSHVARALVARGDQVLVFTRSVKQGHRGLPKEVELCEWDPRSDGAWQEALNGTDAVIQLAGEVLVGRRYTEALKREFYESRVTSTERLVRGIERASRKPAAFVCGSAIGYYGADRGATEFDETSAPGDDFLAQLCVDWEAAARRAESFGVRVVNARLGIVLGHGGGALEQMALPFKFFAGGPIGSGKQIVSWVHMDDAVGIFLRCLDDVSLTGPVNVTAPQPASNGDLSRAIGRALGSPAWLKVPGFALKAMFGEGANPILGGQRVLPKVMLHHGFQFRHPEVGEAVEHALKA